MLLLHRLVSRICCGAEM